MTEFRAATLAGEVRAGLRTPRVERAIAEVAGKAHLSPEWVRDRLNESVLEALDVLGPGYARDMMTAVQNVERLRASVHEYYERTFVGAATEADGPSLADSLQELHEDLLAVSDPQLWARREIAERAAHPAGAAPPAHDVPAAGPHGPGAPPTPGGPGGAGATAGADRPARWETQREVRRIASLDPRRGEAFRKARALRPDLVDAALRGDAGALPALRSGLRGHLTEWEIGATVGAVARVRDPEPSYALGSGTHAAGRRPAETEHAYRTLPADQHEAVRTAISTDPDFVRSMVTAESLYGPRDGVRNPWRPEEMDRYTAQHDIPADQRAALEAGLRRLNEQHRRAVSDIPPGQLGTAHARARAEMLDQAAANLGLPVTDEVVARMARNSVLVDLGRRAPEQLERLAARWLEYAAEKAAKGEPPATLERYIGYIMRSHVRGLLGELTAVFQLGQDVWVLKAPDLRVTDPGTDFVVVVKRTGEGWFADNKALASQGLYAVSSLVRNGPANIAADTLEFGPKIEADDLPLPPELSAALARARVATAEMAPVVEGLTREQLGSLDVQRQLTDICDRNGFRRVVTNAGGELSWLAQRLQDAGIDFANLNDPEINRTGLPAQPRDLSWQQGTAGGTPGGTGGAPGGTGGGPGGTGGGPGGTGAAGGTP